MLFLPSASYTRADLYEILNIPAEKRGGDWETGYHRHGDEHYIFANVGIPGRTEHDYDNKWLGAGRLLWQAKWRRSISSRASWSRGRSGCGG